MGYDEQLSAAKFRAERDLARQECERLRARLRDSVPREAYERKRAAWLRQIRECEAALRKRREHIKRLENAALERRTVREEDREAAERDLARQELYRARRDAENMRVELCSALVIDVDTGWSDAMAELDRRLMPEGYEWPRYESGELLRYKDRYISDGDECEVWHVDFDSYGEATILNSDCSKCSLEKGERVKRPAPKVLDADGVEIRVGDEVWDVDGSGPFIVSGFVGEPLAVIFEIAECNDLPRKPSQLTHRAPVLAADGKALREGETVWSVDSGTRYTVEKITDELIPVKCRSEMGSTVSLHPSQLTHERPESWQRLEDDATMPATAYCKRMWIADDGGYSPEELMARDLVRRAKKLAGVSE